MIVAQGLCYCRFQYGEKPVRPSLRPKGRGSGPGHPTFLPVETVHSCSALSNPKPRPLLVRWRKRGPERQPERPGSGEVLVLTLSEGAISWQAQQRGWGPRRWEVSGEQVGGRHQHLLVCSQPSTASLSASLSQRALCLSILLHPALPEASGRWPGGGRGKRERRRGRGRESRWSVLVLALPLWSLCLPGSSDLRTLAILATAP